MGSGADTRGRLEVFLGCAPGVGKTYEMLSQARGLADEGVDVVIAARDAEQLERSAKALAPPSTIEPRSAPGSTVSPSLARISPS